MNTNIDPHRSQMNDEHLRSVLRIATTKLTPDFDALAKKGDQTPFPLEVNENINNDMV